MKVLIAEDEPVSRRVLTAALENERYDVQIVEDGASALTQLLAAEEPTIALLDWIMPGLDGPEVCRRLRAGAMKLRPYLIIVSAKTHKSEIAAGLDAGADDFISKPVDHGEFLARMRVAERTIGYQLELLKKIEQFDALAQRYSLLGEIVAQQLQSPTPADEFDVAGSLAEPPAAIAPAPPPPTWFGPGEIETLVSRAFTDLGLSISPTVAPPGERATGVSSYTAWAGFIDTRYHRWVDLLLEIDDKAATVVFERALHRRATAPQDIMEFLAETHTVVSATLKAALQAKGCDFVAPLLSRAQQRDLWQPALRIPAESASHRFDLEGVILDLAVVCYPCPPQHRPPGQQQPYEVLAEDYPPPGIVDAPRVVGGAALTHHSIEQLAIYAGSIENPPPLSIYRLSPIARRFHQAPPSRDDV